MIYVTAQRVRSHDGDVGINGFLYETDAGELSEVEFDELIERSLGPPDCQSVSVEPGGNAVESFVDIVVAGIDDDLDVDTVSSRLDNWTDELGNDDYRSPPPRQEAFHDTERLRARFNWNSRIPHEPADELRRLNGRAVGLLARLQEPGSSSRSDDPLEITAARADGELTLSLTERSVQKLEDELDRPLGTSSVSIDSETLEAFERLHGKFLPHAADLLIPVDVDRIDELAGVRVVDERNDQVLWRSFPVPA